MQIGYLILLGMSFVCGVLFSGLFITVVIIREKWKLSAISVCKALNKIYPVSSAMSWYKIEHVNETLTRYRIDHDDVAARFVVEDQETRKVIF